MATPGPAASSSPSKSVRNNTVNGNFIANLQTVHPWTGVDLDLVFHNLLDDKENNSAVAAASHSLGSGKDLSTPERKMTVEEWIYHNADEAEQKLRLECEAMVTAFEREGTRAMMALEGLVAE